MKIVRFWQIGVCIAERVGSLEQQLMICTLSVVPRSTSPSLLFPFLGHPFSPARKFGAFYVYALSEFSYWQLQLINLSSAIALSNYTPSPNLVYCIYSPHQYHCNQEYQ